MNKRLGRILQPNMAVYFVFMFGFGVAAVFLRQYILAIAEFALTGLLFLVFILRRRIRRKEIRAFLEKHLEGVSISHGAREPFPMVAFRLGDGGIVYTNEAFDRILRLGDTMRERRIESVLPDFSADWLMSGKSESPNDIILENRRYRVFGTQTSVDDQYATRVGVLYLTDLTELYQVRDEYIRSRPVVSLIVVDNYDELTKNMTEGGVSALHAQINNALTKWAEGYQGILRRLEKNRFLFIFEKRDLKQAIEEKFSILEKIHEITSPSGLPVSLSIGIGVDAETFGEAYNFAALSIEMALSRGGDQAVVKDRINFNFYGGRTKETEHRSKVRSRVTANSLMELISQSSQVFIMGHKSADMDALGAAVGIACMCRKKGKPAKIVLNRETNMAGPILEELEQTPEYKGIFVSGQDALLACDNRSTLVVVDTNRPDQVEFKPLLEALSRVCVIDHHRRAADYIKPVVVNLHEPFASSAAELVTELLEYAVEPKDVLPVEAKALMAGIFLDTKSFHVRTGQRTFEAAGYLRQLGADTVEVKKLMQNDFQDTLAKHQIIKAARLYRQQIAIAALNAGTTRSLAAQSADELLNISGITASFVLYPDEDRVIISARSIGDANVQVILEPLGGGGNSASAGAQVKDSNVKEVLDRLVASIDRFYTE